MTQPRKMRLSWDLATLEAVVFFVYSLCRETTEDSRSTSCKFEDEVVQSN